MSSKNDVAILVSSCDKFSDAWHPFFSLFFKYWPENKYPVYLLGNRQTYPDTRVHTIHVDADLPWSTCLRLALEEIPQPYIVLFFEDFLIEEPVDIKTLEKYITYLQDKNAGYLGLQPYPEPSIILSDSSEVGEIAKGSEYRVSLLVAIWEKQTLLNLIVDDETPWELELSGSKRSNDLDVSFLRVWKNAEDHYPITHAPRTAIIRGRWSRDAVQLCKKEGINIDLSVRPMIPLSEHWRRSRPGLMKYKLYRGVIAGMMRLEQLFNKL
ncbi:MAG: hypothetical protein AAF639_09870 [Chloroflexota bacterium]